VPNYYTLQPHHRSNYFASNTITRGFVLVCACDPACLSVLLVVVRGEARSVGFFESRNIQSYRSVVNSMYPTRSNKYIEPNVAPLANYCSITGNCVCILIV